MKTRFGVDRFCERPMRSLPPSQSAYLLDIMRSLEAIQRYVAGQTREDFLILVAGEAAARLTPETRAEFPVVPFHRMVAMRHRVVHDYGNVDFEIVWETVQTHLPPLLEQLNAFFGDSDHLLQ